QNPHGGDLSALAGKITIDAVGDRRRDKQHGGKQFLLAMNTAKTRCRQHPNQQGNAENAYKRNGVRQIHGHQSAVCRRSQAERWLDYPHRWERKEMESGTKDFAGAEKKTKGRPRLGSATPSMVPARLPNPV